MASAVFCARFAAVTLVQMPVLLHTRPVPKGEPLGNPQEGAQGKFVSDRHCKTLCCTLPVTPWFRITARKSRFNPFRRWISLAIEIKIGLTAWQATRADISEDITRCDSNVAYFGT